MVDLEFNGRSFCFTGKLADLKRSTAEREVRSRGGLTTGVINAQLDYLVVGSIPATGWKHGSYGRKIESARQRHESGEDKPMLVAESDLMDAFARVPSTNSGAIDGKVVVVTYTACLPDRRSIDRRSLESLLSCLQTEYGCHVRSLVVPARVRNELFRTPSDLPSDYLVFEFRVVRHLPLDDPTSEYVTEVIRGFEDVPGLDGNASYFERVEGSADYIRLLREVPESLRVPDL